jgi:hypothetical protein
MRVKTGDLLMALAMLALSVALYIQSGEIDTTMIYALGPVFFPKILIGILAVLSLVLLYQSVDLTGRKGWCQPVKKATANAFVLRWSLVALVLVYLVVLPLAGYVYATIPFLFAGMCLLGPLKPKDLAIYAVTSVAVALGLQYIFATLLKLFLP